VGEQGVAIAGVGEGCVAEDSRQGRFIEGNGAAHEHRSHPSLPSADLSGRERIRARRVSTTGP